MLDRQVAERFIGHENEIEQFERWLQEKNPNAPWILFLHDATDNPAKKGGVGKTWLLRKCQAKVLQKSKQFVTVFIDFFTIADRDPVTIVRHIVESLRQLDSQWSPVFFDEVYAEYQGAIEQGKDELYFRSRLSAALMEDLQKLDQLLNTTEKYLLVYFDTFEQMEKNPEAVVLSLSGTFPDRYNFKHMKVIIAGRNAPDWEHPNWKGRQSEVLQVPVTSFKREEMVQFLKANCNTIEPLDAHSVQARALHERTEGRPILVGLVTDVLNKRIQTLDELLETPPEDFEPHLVTQINRLNEPINLVVLFMAHIYHRFNKELLDWLSEHSSAIKEMVRNTETQRLTEQLLELSFVRRPGSGDDVALHDEMRRLVNRYNWQGQEIPEGEYRQELSKLVIKYYNHIIAREPKERMRQIYTVEMLYHELFIDTNKGFDAFKQRFHKAIDLWQTAYARSMLQEAKQFSRQFTAEQNYELLAAEALLLRREENGAAALSLYGMLEQEADQHWLKVHRATILFEKGQCYQQLSKFDDAKVCYYNSLEIEKAFDNQTRVADILKNLGYVSRRSGELEKAKSYYQESMGIYKKNENWVGYADTLNIMGGVSRLQGRMNEALRYCNVALRIRQDLYNNGETTEVAVGLTLGSIGVIYLREDDLVNAEQYFSRALDIFRRRRYQRGIALIHIRFGQIALARGNLQNAMESFTQGYREALGIDVEAEINSLNKQARVYIQEGKLQKEKLREALPLLQKAIQRAEKVYDVYQQAESLIDLANTYELLNQGEDAFQALRQAEAISNEYKYYYLLGLASDFRGDNRYTTEKYHEAFKYYGDYCYYMALYNPVQYEKAVRKTTDLLVKIPKEEISAILDEFQARWKSRDLKEDSGLLVEALAEIRMLTDTY